MDQKGQRAPQDNDRTKDQQLAEITTQKDKLLDLYLSELFSKEQLDEKAEPLKAEEERLQYAIKQLSRSNEEVQADIAAVDEAIEYLQGQRELWRKEFKTISREEKIAGQCAGQDKLVPLFVILCP